PVMSRPASSCAINPNPPRIQVLEGAPSFANCAKGGLRRSNVTHPLLSTLVFLFPRQTRQSRSPQVHFSRPAKLFTHNPRRRIHPNPRHHTMPCLLFRHIPQIANHHFVAILRFVHSGARNTCRAQEFAPHCRLLDGRQHRRLFR